ncbi:amidohydrolase family protein [Lacimicrobium alkaliphilum]|uniref:Amidohydrolase n=1 Tax=Lacimicrobium alkaliphilum TaxID=1526571 RepID=A0ABQ1R8S0_9ALTE|nr:amidohydrolase family protein [Lacimicrobium alkaliphilum]GGD60246.1 amidohydrolase [Lacimicrobium alkaliphilum]
MNTLFSCLRWGALVFGLLSPPLVMAQTVAFTNATLYPITDKVIDNGTLVIRDGKIAAIGSASEVTVPKGAKIVDAKGRIIMPGIVDTHSHLGVAGDHGEGSATLNPELRILDSFWAADPRIKVARAGGITVSNVMPGSGNVIGGQTIYVKLRDGTADEMLVQGSVGGLKMANGENPKGDDKSPNTRMAAAALARQEYYDAIAYGKKRKAAGEDDDAKTPDLDLGLNTLLEVLDGKRIVHHHTHRSDDIMTVLRLQDEFGFRLVLQHGIESYKLAEELAKRDVMVSYILLDSPGGKHEATETRLDGPAQLEKAGLEIALHSDDWVIDSRFLLRAAALAVRGGMSREGALRALTINPAKMLDLDKQLGSLEVGKDADLVLFDGDPLSLYTHVRQTWIDGQKVYDRSNKEQRLYATGGFRVAERYPHLGEEQ